MKRAERWVPWLMYGCMLYEIWGLDLVAFLVVVFSWVIAVHLEYAQGLDDGSHLTHAAYMKVLKESGLV